jgi:hypothetical protein
MIEALEAVYKGSEQIIEKERAQGFDGFLSQRC